MGIRGPNTGGLKLCFGGQQMNGHRMHMCVIWKECLLRKYCAGCGAVGSFKSTCAAFCLCGKPG